ncbi:PREDICTED: uncharacterized protein LOC104715558 [Camelina sativa]|uniref:Uncharacterized protein LOC104715558 n=1 Tax=Camelina sativa TaxID=90675 RepID=A0ABM0TTR1_CAMSA|nr:PREDICTED: uncharacterized protein LOC104715558 [Camelina sativa]
MKSIFSGFQYDSSSDEELHTPPSSLPPPTPLAPIDPATAMVVYQPQEESVTASPTRVDRVPSPSHGNQETCDSSSSPPREVTSRFPVVDLTGDVPVPTVSNQGISSRLRKRQSAVDTDGRESKRLMLRLLVWQDSVKKGEIGTKFHTRIDEALSKWLMDITSDEKIDDGDADIDIPTEVSNIDCPDFMKTIVKEVYGESFASASSYGPRYCRDKVILCHTDDEVDQINDYMLSLLPGEEKLCYSDDCIAPPRDEHKSRNPIDYILLPPSMFAYCEVPGVPQQVLRLKVGAPVMLLTDIDPSRGLSTGTRLQITMVGDSLLTAKFATPSDYYGEFVIPKTHMFAAEGFPASLRRTQYPLTLAFAMTIDKSRGQTFSKVGLYLPSRQLRDGHRYLAISKVKATTGVTQVLFTKKDDKPQEDAENVVFMKLFRGL